MDKQNTFNVVMINSFFCLSFDILIFSAEFPCSNPRVYGISREALAEIEKGIWWLGGSPACPTNRNNSSRWQGSGSKIMAHHAIWNCKRNKVCLFIWNDFWIFLPNYRSKEGIFLVWLIFSKEEHGLFSSFYLGRGSNKEVNLFFKGSFHLLTYPNL